MRATIVRVHSAVLLPPIGSLVLCFVALALSPGFGAIGLIGVLSFAPVSIALGYAGTYLVRRRVETLDVWPARGLQFAALFGGATIAWLLSPLVFAGFGALLTLVTPDAHFTPLGDTYFPSLWLLSAPYALYVGLALVSTFIALRAGDSSGQGSQQGTAVLQ